MRKLVISSALLMSLTTSMPNTAITNNLDVIDTKKIELLSSINKAVENNMGHLSANLPIISPIETKDIIRISDLYGYRPIHPILKIPSYHKGIDFSIDINTNIKSVADGIVKKVTHSNRGYGNYIEIDHGNGYSTIYAHLNKILVQENEIVLANTIIGLSGNSGLSTGPHLHFEIRLHNKPINPILMYDVKGKNKHDIEKNYLNILVSLEKYII